MSRLFQIVDAAEDAVADAVAGDATQSRLRKAIPPEPHGSTGATQLSCNVLVLNTTRCGEHDLCSEHKPRRRASIPRSFQQRHSIFCGQLDRRGNSDRLIIFL